MFPIFLLLMFATLTIEFKIDRIYIQWEYVFNGVFGGRREFVLNLSLSLLTSIALTILISIITYLNEKEKSIFVFINNIKKFCTAYNKIKYFYSPIEQEILCKVLLNNSLTNDKKIIWNANKDYDELSEFYIRKYPNVDFTNQMQLDINNAEESYEKVLDSLFLFDEFDITIVIDSYENISFFFSKAKKYKLITEIYKIVLKRYKDIHMSIDYIKEVPINMKLTTIYDMQKKMFESPYKNQGYINSTPKNQYVNEIEELIKKLKYKENPNE